MRCRWRHAAHRIMAREHCAARWPGSLLLSPHERLSSIATSSTDMAACEGIMPCGMGGGETPKKPGRML